MILSDAELSVVYERAAELVNDGWTKSFCAFNRSTNKAYREHELYNLPDLENTSFCAYGALVYAAREKQILMVEKGNELDVLIIPLTEYISKSEDFGSLVAGDSRRPLLYVAHWNDHPENTNQHVAGSLMQISQNLKNTPTQGD